MSKIINKRKAKQASLPKLNKVKGFIEKLIRKKDLLKEPNVCGRLLQLKEDDLSYPNYCIMQKDHDGDHTDYRGRVGQPLNFSFRSQGNVFFDQKSNCSKVVAEGLKTNLENALTSRVDTPPIQYFQKINTEDALARGVASSTITRDKDLINGVFTPSSDDHLTENKEEISSTKQDYFIIEKKQSTEFTSGQCAYSLVLGNHDNSLPVNPTTYYCVLDQTHGGPHQTYRNYISIQWEDPEIDSAIPTSENNASFSRNSETSESLDERKLKLIRELFCLNNLTAYIGLNLPDIYCLASRGHQGSCEEVTINNFVADVFELLNKEKELSSSNNRVYPAITEQQAKDCIEAIDNGTALQFIPNQVVALAVCNKQFNDFDGNIFYCLDEIGHERECGYYSAATLLDKLQKRLEGLNKQMEDKTI